MVKYVYIKQIDTVLRCKSAFFAVKRYSFSPQKVLFQKLKESLLQPAVNQRYIKAICKDKRDTEF